eukprot:gene11192-11342_t
MLLTQDGPALATDVVFFLVVSDLLQHLLQCKTTACVLVNAAFIAGALEDKWWLSESSGSEDELEQEQAPDPLYDPFADDEDEKWAGQQRNQRHTDAILSCPGCFTTLCIDCQQHEVYHTQYRAMLTINCEVKHDQLMRSEVQPSKQKRRGKRKAADSEAQPESQQDKQEDMLHPVLCAVCGTQVGAQDAEEVVHFFHVLASES